MEPTGAEKMRLLVTSAEGLYTYFMISYSMHIPMWLMADSTLRDVWGYSFKAMAPGIAFVVWLVIVVYVDLVYRSAPRFCDAIAPPAARLVPVLVGNAVLHALVYLLYALFVDRGFELRVQLYGWTALEIVVCFALYEAIFYVLHRALHARLARFHALHHETHANLGVTNFYMHPVDYALEVIVPLWTAIAVVDPSLQSTVSVIVIGVINSVVSHSGVKVAGFPDPRDHWLHHHLAVCNYGTGPLDVLAGTYRASSNVAFTCRQRV